MNSSRETILLAALEERYRAMAVIRDRVQTVALWVLGLLSAGAGWIIGDEPALSYAQQLFISGALVVVIGAVRLGYFFDLQSGFRSQQRVAVRIETELGFYDPGALAQNGQGDPIYPGTWKNAGDKNGDGRFFATNYMLLYIGTAVFLLAVWI